MSVKQLIGILIMVSPIIICIIIDFLENPLLTLKVLGCIILLVVTVSFGASLVLGVI